MTDFAKTARELVDSTTDLDAQDEDYWGAVQAAEGILQRVHDDATKAEQKRIHVWICNNHYSEDDLIAMIVGAK